MTPGWYPMHALGLALQMACWAQIIEFFRGTPQEQAVMREYARWHSIHVWPDCLIAERSGP